MWLSGKTRPDLTYAVNNCARYMAKPDKSHFTALDRIWKYLIRYPDLGLYISHNSDIGLIGYSDSDWANCLMNRKSTTGYCFLYNRNLISWNSALQRTVAISTCEAEYMAIREATKETIYLSSILKWLEKEKLGTYLPTTPPILTDSEAALKLANNPEFHKRTKHIDITYHFIRECIRDNKVIVVHIKTSEQIADGLTKCISSRKHHVMVEVFKLKPKGEGEKPEGKKVRFVDNKA